jgi:sigma-B regulation protein RsbQ
MHFAPVVVGDPQNSAAIGEFRRSLCSMRPDVALAMAQTIFQMDMRGRLDGLETPTTIIQPRHDPAVPVAIAHYLARHWPAARVEMIEVTGHLPHLTAPAELIEILAQCLPGFAADVAGVSASDWS